MQPTTDVKDGITLPVTAPGLGPRSTGETTPVWIPHHVLIAVATSDRRDAWNSQGTPIPDLTFNMSRALVQAGYAAKGHRIYGLNALKKRLGLPTDPKDD